MAAEAQSNSTLMCRELVVRGCLVKHPLTVARGGYSDIHTNAGNVQIMRRGVKLPHNLTIHGRFARRKNESFLLHNLISVLWLR
jgi:hypothetical protein